MNVLKYNLLLAKSATLQNFPLAESNRPSSCVTACTRTHSETLTPNDSNQPVAFRYVFYSF